MENPSGFVVEPGSDGDPLTDLRMRLHDLKLVSIEGLTLEEDGVGNRDLADIVQQAGTTDSGDVSGGSPSSLPISAAISETASE